VILEWMSPPPSRKSAGKATFSRILSGFDPGKRKDLFDFALQQRYTEIFHNYLLTVLKAASKTLCVLVGGPSQVFFSLKVFKDEQVLTTCSLKAWYTRSTTRIYVHIN
jgi:hypothetical protein